MTITETLYVIHRDQWREWLEEHHERKTEIWLIYYKKHTGQPRIPYDHAVEEALCFGWIDSTVKRIDDETFAQRFTPRKDIRNWSGPNIKRLRSLFKDDRMTEAGIAKVAVPVLEQVRGGEGRRAKGEGRGAASQRREAGEKNMERRITPKLSKALESVLKENTAAWKHFNGLAPSHRKQYVEWIMSAKREETRERRLGQAIELLERGEKLGMK